MTDMAIRGKWKVLLLITGRLLELGLAGRGKEEEEAEQSRSMTKRRATGDRALGPPKLQQRGPRLQAHRQEADGKGTRMEACVRC